MKKNILIISFFVSVLSYSQVDNLNVKKPRKENRFKVAFNVLKNSVTNIPSDFSEMGHVISDDWKRAGIYLGGIIGLIAVDKYTTGILHDHIEPAVDYKIPNITFIENRIPWLWGNDAYISYPLIGLYAGSFAFNYEKGQIVAVNAFKSMAYSFVISHIILKSILARHRPFRNINGNDPVEPPYTRDVWDFGNFHPVRGGSDHFGTAIPSLHATAFFAVAKVIQMEYNNYFLPYAFVTGVFMADLKLHEHWISDLVVGGLIGTIIGRTVVLNSRKQRARKNNKLVNFKSKKTKIKKQIIPKISGPVIGLKFVGTF